MGSLKYYLSKIGYRNDTTCVRSTNLELIKHNLTSIFKKEGYRPISQPPLPLNSDNLIEELFSSPYKTKPYLWVIGLLSSDSGWTTIKTSVEDLLCRGKKTRNCSKLLELAVLSNSDVFHHSCDDKSLGIMFEVDSSGETLVTGYNNECDDINNMYFYSEPVLQLNNQQNFCLLDMPIPFQTAGIRAKLNEGEKQIRNKELNKMFQEGNNEETEKIVAEWKKINMGKRERFDRELGSLICKSSFFWHEGNIFYKAYTEPEKIQQNKIELLFFQVGRFDLNPTKKEIWSPIENFNWIDYSTELKKANL